MRRTLLALCVAVLATGPLTAPLGAADRATQQMMADIRMLQEQTQQLQLALANLTDALKTVSTKIDEQTGSTRKGFADQKLLVDNVASDLRVLREKLDDTNVRLTSLSQDVDGLRELIPQAAPALAVPPATDGTGAPIPGAQAPPVAPPPPMGTGTTPRKLYETAYADYTAGQWSLAIQGFEMYLKTYPRSELADDAQYYIGESYAGDSKFREALQAYERVKDYPNGNILPEAYYKIGQTQDRLGQLDEARSAFEYVVKTYPETDAGRLAKQNLDRLNRRVR
jgi:tol-pal system protein YbgF